MISVIFLLSLSEKYYNRLKRSMYCLDQTFVDNKFHMLESKCCYTDWSAGFVEELDNLIMCFKLQTVLFDITYCL